MQRYHRFAYALLMLALLILLGACGYVLIEGWSFADGLYMTVITVGTVGYGETHPLTDAGHIYTMLLIMFSIGIMVYATSSLTAIIVEGDLHEIFKRRKMKKTISQLHGHYIICGDSQTCTHIIEELERTLHPFVVIERDPVKVATLIQQGFKVLEGDATLDTTLLEAGVNRATGLLTCVSSDSDNLFIVLTARRLNPKLRIVTKALVPASGDKLKQVGADAVVMPKAIGGLRMASELLRPHVVNFLDEMLRIRENTIRVEEIVLREGAKAIGKKLGGTPIPEATGASLVALIREKKHIFNPPQDTELATGDVLIMLGEILAIKQLRAAIA